MGRLFVYGTLRLGAGNEFAELLSKSCTHLGAGSISGRIYRISHYPGLVPSKSEKERVIGDLFESITADLLARLDGYEGDEYTREIVEVQLEGGRKLDAFAYYYRLPTTWLEWIRSGDWNQPDRNEK